MQPPNYQQPKPIPQEMGVVDLLRSIRAIMIFWTVMMVVGIGFGFLALSENGL